MTPVALVRDLASAKILELCPELQGLVTFDAHVPNVAPFMALVELRVELNAGCWEKLPVNTTVHDMAGGIAGKLEAILDKFRTHEPEGGFDFKHGNNVWLIGDGDDWGAVEMLGSHTAIVWVRTWGESL